jgi:hypothetical protein
MKIPRRCTKMRELFRSMLISAGLLFYGANSFAEQGTAGGTNSETMKRDTIGNTGAAGGNPGMAGGTTGDQETG